MSQVMKKTAVVQGKTCIKCAATDRSLKAAGMCGPCYRKAHTVIAACASCGREMKIEARGLCARCHRSLPRGGEKNIKRRELTAAELAAAKAREQDFLERILPVVEKHARFVFSQANWHQEEIEEAIQEVRGLAWRHFVKQLALGHEPCGYPPFLAQHVVSRYRRWHRLTGKVSPEDVLSLRYAAEKGMQRLLLDSNPVALHHSERGLNSLFELELNLDFRAWLEFVSPKAATILAYVMEGNSWSAAEKVFRMSHRWMHELRKQLWESWCVFSRGE